MLGEQVPIPLQFCHIDYDGIGVLAAGVDLDQAAADVGFFSIPCKCQVYLAGAEIVETCAGTTKGVVKFDKRPTAGSDVNRGNGDIAELNMGTTPAGKLLYDKVARGQVLNPGEQVVVEIAERPVTGAAGQFNPVLLVVPVPETLANLVNAVETA
jgi:hypothetical protein